MIVNLTDFAPDPNDCGPALQRAIDACAQRSSGINGGTVVIPSGEWLMATGVQMHGVDSVTIEGDGGPGVWPGPVGAYGHHSSKLLWTGPQGATMISIDQAMACTVRGIMLEGKGEAAVGVRVTGRPTRMTTIENCVILGFAQRCVVVGSDVIPAPDVTATVVRRSWLARAPVCFEQQGSQTVTNAIEDCIVSEYTERGAVYLGGDVMINRVGFYGATSSRSDVYVSRACGRARFVANNHEIGGDCGYEFERTDSTHLRPRSTLFVGVRASHKGTGVRRFVDWAQDGALTFVGCEWDGYDGRLAEVYLEAPDVAARDVTLIQEVGCRYSNGAKCTTVGPEMHHASWTSNGNSIANQGAADNLINHSTLRLHNSVLVLQDDKAGGIVPAKLSSYMGYLQLDLADTVPLAMRVMVNGKQAFRLSKSGVPGFGGANPPAVKPSVEAETDAGRVQKIIEALRALGLVQ